MTVLAWLPSARPSALTSSPDFLRSSSSLCMNWIISTIHSLPMVASPASADPNVMIMYFTVSLLDLTPRTQRLRLEFAGTPFLGALNQRFHHQVGADVPFSTSAWARFSGGASALSPRVDTRRRV